MTEFTRVAPVTDIPEGTLRRYEIGPHSIVIAHTAEGFFAVDDECSHERVSLSEGYSRGGDIVCPAHGARFSLETGAVTGAPAIVPIETFELKVEGNEVFVLLEV